MGREAVVNPQLQVYWGWVADASIADCHYGNTNAACIMIGEKAAT